MALGELEQFLSLYQEWFLGRVFGITIYCGCIAINCLIRTLAWNGTHDVASAR